MKLKVNGKDVSVESVTSSSDISLSLNKIFPGDYRQLRSFCIDGHFSPSFVRDHIGETKSRS